MKTLEDHQIVDMYWAREESAISETDAKYGRMLNGISFAIVKTDEDAGECLNDTYLAAWNSMPDNRPDYLGAYLSKIIRRLSINRYKMTHREKRGGMDAFTDELTECVKSDGGVEDEIEKSELAEAINRFLGGLTYEKRYVFVRRYFYSDSLEGISEKTGYSVPKLKSMLMRIRSTLKEELEKEGHL